MGKALTYDRRIFDVPDVTAAKRVILTDEDEMTTDERWARETPYLVDLIGTQIGPRAGGLYVDYGCGIGRLAKPLIERYGCHVLGVDISERMRALAVDHVQSQSFSIVSPHLMLTMVCAGLRIDGALSVWALQHSLSPAPEIAMLADALKPSGRLFVANLYARAVPTAEGRWANDGIDVQALLQSRLSTISLGKLDPAAVSQKTSDRTYWGTFARSS